MKRLRKLRRGLEKTPKPGSAVLFGLYCPAFSLSSLCGEKERAHSRYERCGQRAVKRGEAGLTNRPEHLIVVE